MTTTTNTTNTSATLTDTLNALLALRVRGSDAVAFDLALRPGLKAAISCGWVKVVDNWNLVITAAGHLALE